jgi:tetratricopeptide (TPR) repeat protein
MSAKCDQCGVQTEIPESFFKERKTFKTSIRTLCPTCHAKSHLSYLKWVFISYFAIGGLGLIYRWFLPTEGIGWYLLNLFFFEVFLVATILPHEFGHAFAARLLGFRTFKIVIGFGKIILIKKLFGFETEFRPIPLGGVTIAVHRDKNWFRLKQFSYIFAGPLVNLLLCLSIRLLFPSIDFWRFGNLMHGLAFGQVFFYANVYVLIVNLWPREILTSAGKIPSDGLSLFKTLFLKQKAMDENHAAWFMIEGLELRRKCLPAEALVWIERGLQLYPENINLLNLYGVILIELKEYEKAREYFLKLLSRAGSPPAMQALFQNNIAYLDALIGRADLLAEADDFSQKALAVLGWHPAIKGTRGTVLLELGDFDHAIPLLLAAMNEQDELTNKAQNACFVSIAEAKRGNLLDSRKYLDEAKKLMPTCFLLERAETTLKNASIKTASI